MWPFEILSISREDRKTIKGMMIKATMTCEATPIKLLTQLTARPEDATGPSSNVCRQFLGDLIQLGFDIRRRRDCLENRRWLHWPSPNKLAGYERNSPLVVGRLESRQLRPQIKSTAIKKKTKEIAKIRLSPFLSRKSTIGLSR